MYGHLPLAVLQRHADFLYLQVVLAGTAVAHSGAGDETQKPTVLKTPCQFNTCPKGSPAEGSDPNDRKSQFPNTKSDG